MVVIIWKCEYNNDFKNKKCLYEVFACVCLDFFTEKLADSGQNIFDNVVKLRYYQT